MAFGSIPSDRAYTRPWIDPASALSGDRAQIDIGMVDPFLPIPTRGCGTVCADAHISEPANGSACLRDVEGEAAPLSHIDGTRPVNIGLPIDDKAARRQDRPARSRSWERQYRYDCRGGVRRN